MFISSLILISLCLSFSHLGYHWFRHKHCSTFGLFSNGKFKRASYWTSSSGFFAAVFVASENWRSYCKSCCLQKSCVHCDLLCWNFPSCIWNFQVCFDLLNQNLFWFDWPFLHHKQTSQLHLITGWGFLWIFYHMLPLLGSWVVQPLSLVFNNWKVCLGSVNSPPTQMLSQS